MVSGRSESRRRGLVLAGLVGLALADSVLAMAGVPSVTAAFDSERRAPRCPNIGHTCDSGTLLNGRAGLGPEPNQPNALRYSCQDGTSGRYHVAESNDRIRVFTLDGTPLAAGKTVTVEATVWAGPYYATDRLHLYHSPNGTFPEWTLFAILTPANAGLGVLSATYTLPEGGLQAVRARFDYGDYPGSCASGYFSDHDDLIFPVAPAHQPVADPGGPYAGAVGVPLAFSGLGSMDADGDPLTYAWDFGDGSSGTGATPSHAYPASGTYTVRLEVSDGVETSEPAETSANIVVSTDTVPPTILLTFPTPDAHLSGTVAVSADATDDVAVTRVELYVDDVLAATSAPFGVLWDTTLAADGPHTVKTRAVDFGGNTADSDSVPVTVGNGKAEFDADLGVPRCTQPGRVCDSGALLNGRGSLGPEPNTPNTIYGSCPDSSNGVYHSDESNDRLRVFTEDGLPMAPGKVVRVEATVWAYSEFGTDKLDLYYAASAETPAWTFIGTLSPTGAGAQVLSTTYTLPAGTLQAVRARFRYDGAAWACGAADYTDHDDLAFPVNAPPIARPGGPYSGAARQSITFTGAGSTDPEGEPLTYTWDFGDGATGTGPTPTHDYMTPGPYTVTLVVNDGQFDSMPASTTVTITNARPVANAGGPYRARRGEAITMSGSGSDADGDALTYRWDFGDGTTGTGATPSHTYSATRTFVVSLTVNDGLLDSAPATTSATIENSPPVANTGGPYAGVRNVAINFQGSATDADKDYLSYRWDFGDGTGYAFELRPWHTYKAVGTYTAKLRVGDGSTETTATTVVTIANRPPVARAGGPYTFRRGVLVTLSGTGTDADGDPLTYRWDFGDGGTGTGKSPTHVYANFGTYTATLIVNDGYVDSSPSTATVNVVNWVPIANAHGPYVGTHAVPIVFGGTAIDADGDPLTYRWDFGDGTSAAGRVVSHAFAAPGTFTVKLVANDGRVDSAPAQTTATVTNQAPVANAGGSKTGVRGVPITFSGSGTDVNGDPLTFRWSFGDGGTAIGATAAHTYSSLGTFTVTLIANDGRADSAPSTTTARIDNRAPVSLPGGPYTGERGVPVAFNGSGTDADGDPLTYSWIFQQGVPTTGTGATVQSTFATPGVRSVGLTVSDGYTSAQQWTTVTVTNRRPVANPGGPYSGVRQVPITFNASGTDADGDPLTYRWDFGDFRTATGATVTHAYAALGTFVVTVTAYDGYTYSAPVTTTATISNRPPAANPGGPYSGYKRLPVAFAGSGTDADGDALTYRWDFGDGTPGGTAPTPSHAYATASTFNVTLTVNDGLADSVPVTTTVTITNRPPVADAGGPYVGAQGLPIAFNGSGTDPDGDALNYRWDFGDGTTTVAGRDPGHAYATVGTFSATLVVSDGVAESSATAAVTIRPRPIANPGGPYTGPRGVIAFDGSRSQGAGPLTYRWSFGDGAIATGSDRPTHGYTSIGSYRVMLVVNDGIADSLPGETTATIVNQLPVANPGGPYTGVRAEPVAFGGSATDADGDPLTYTWHFGDGTTAPGPAATHVYSTVGTFTATLVVGDGQLVGPSSGSATTIVTISNRPPVPNPGGPYTGVRGVAIAFNGSGTDPDGDPLTYQWSFGDGGTATTATAPHAYGSLGTFTVALAVNDGFLASSATTTATITNLPPVAKAGADFLIGRGTLVSLDGRGSYDQDTAPFGSIAGYVWRQIGGPRVTLSAANTAQPRFVTPSVSFTTTLAFELTVTDNDGTVATDEVEVTVCGYPKTCLSER